MRREMVVEDEEGRLYLVEERLDQNLRSKRKDMILPGRS
jgi:hypothetical protein